jgi:shikimate dehydrogenase
MKKNNKPYQLALFGHPVNHSLSPKIHQQFAEQFKLAIDYQLIDCKKTEFANSIKKFFKKGGHGANVTLPYKADALELVDWISTRAEQAQAINTLFKKNERINGDNTDGVGLINDLNNRCQFECTAKNILILGAGGATQGIVPAIMQQQPHQIVVANRTLKKAQAICHFKNSKALTFSQLNELAEKFDLIIHTSSLGHQGRCLEFSPIHIHDKTISYDLSYGKAAEPFLKFSRKRGISIAYDGKGMLIEQAACSFEKWFELKPATDSIKF